MQSQNILPTSSKKFRTLHNIRRLVTWAILYVLVSNFNLITFGLFILAFWKPLEAIAIFVLLLILVLAGTRIRVPRTFTGWRRLLVWLMETPKEDK